MNKNEFLCKAKLLNNGQWVTGAIMFHDNDLATIFRQHPMDGTLQGFEVDPSAVCRCTGKEDANKHLLFENDVVMRLSKDKAPLELLQVSFEAGCWYVSTVATFDVNCRFSSMQLNESDIEQCQIVGNIYDEDIQSMKDRFITNDMENDYER